MIYGTIQLARRNRFGGAGTGAGSTVNAGLWVDNGDFAYFCNCLYGASWNTGFAADAFFLVNNVCHDNFSFVFIM